jgi:hypothetical protein
LVLLRSPTVTRELSVFYCAFFVRRCTRPNTAADVITLIWTPCGRFARHIVYSMAQLVPDQWLPGSHRR